MCVWADVQLQKQRQQSELVLLKQLGNANFGRMQLSLIAWKDQTCLCQAAVWSELMINGNKLWNAWVQYLISSDLWCWPTWRVNSDALKFKCVFRGAQLYGIVDLGLFIHINLFVFCKSAIWQQLQCSEKKRIFNAFLFLKYMTRRYLKHYFFFTKMRDVIRDTRHALG